MASGLVFFILYGSWFEIYSPLPWIIISRGELDEFFCGTAPLNLHIQMYSWSGLYFLSVGRRRRWRNQRKAKNKKNNCSNCRTGKFRICTAHKSNSIRVWPLIPFYNSLYVCRLGGGVGCWTDMNYLVPGTWIKLEPSCRFCVLSFAICWLCCSSLVAAAAVVAALKSTYNLMPNPLLSSAYSVLFPVPL